MNRGDVIRYVDMTIEEGFSLQRGMNYMVNGKNYAIILMSVEKTLLMQIDLKMTAQL